MKYTGNGICISRQRQQNSINKPQGILQMFYHILVHWHTYPFLKKKNTKQGTISHENLCFVEMKVFTDLFQYDIASPCNKPSLHLPSLSRLLFRPGLKAVHKPPRNLWKFLRQTMRWTQLLKLKSTDSLLATVVQASLSSKLGFKFGYLSFTCTTGHIANAALSTIYLNILLPFYFPYFRRSGYYL